MLNIRRAARHLVPAHVVLHAAEMLASHLVVHLTSTLQYSASPTWKDILPLPWSCRPTKACKCSFIFILFPRPLLQLENGRNVAEQTQWGDEERVERRGGERKKKKKRLKQLTYFHMTKLISLTKSYFKEMPLIKKIQDMDKAATVVCMAVNKSFCKFVEFS